jgi:dolichyl-phosphate-mannose-protein mannosyltransferase
MPRAPHWESARSSSRRSRQAEVGVRSTSNALSLLEREIVHSNAAVSQYVEPIYIEPDTALETRRGGSHRLELAWRLIPITAITLIAAVLRLASLGAAGFRIDEGFTLICSRQSWAGVIGLHGYYTLHPPLFFTLVKIANLALPETIAARSIAALAGIATIPIFYALCMRLLDSRVALGAATLLTFSPLHVEFSRDGRMYAPIFLFVTLGWLALVAYIQTRGRGWAVLYGATLVLAFYTDYSAAYAIAPQAVVLLVFVVHARRSASWLVGAAIGAALCYLPWLPQVYRAIDRSSGNEGRADFLAASWHRIGDSALSLLGFLGRTVTAGGNTPDAWARWHGARPWLLALIILALLNGLIVLWRRKAVLAIAVTMAVVTPLAAIILSQVSPGYAPRTIMAGLLGIFIIASVFLIRQSLSLAIRSFGAIGWTLMLVIAAASLPDTYEAGSRTEWPQITRDLIEQRALSKPILVFSTAGMLTDMIDMYAGNDLAGEQIITVQDGKRERTIGYHRWADRGLSLADIQSGALAGNLSQSDPRTDAVWVILRFGGGKIPNYLADLGYQRIGAFKYTDTVLYLFARPNAKLGEEVRIDPTFGVAPGGADGWRISGKRVPNEDSESGQVLGFAGDRGSATYSYSSGASGLFSVDLEWRAEPEKAKATVKCIGEDGTILASASATPGESDGTVFQPVRLAALCPRETSSIELVLQKRGSGEVEFRGVHAQFSQDQPGDPD